MIRRLLFVLCLFLASSVNAAGPNIVIVLCDDLGYGDVKALNPTGKIATPQLDRIAKEGMIFTDAHSGSAVCTPTRYGLVTGRYAWRSKLQRGVLGGLSPRLIESERSTIGSLAKRKGYHTACIGKWHLGLDWVKHAGKGVNELGIESAEQNGSIDFSKPYANGPNSLGFDYYYGIAASLDMVPYTFLENDRVVALPSITNKFPFLPDGSSKKNTRSGPAAPEFDAFDVLPRLTEKAIAYVDSRAAAAKAGTPFLMYVPLASPHTPILPTKAWQGRSGLSPYADFVMETDDAIGRLLAALEKNGLADDTLFIVTSDNGCSPEANFPELLGKGHNPSHVFRGHKADIFEGGHRVPFLARWPKRVQAASMSDRTTCLTDLYATTAEILGEKLAANEAEDSESLLAALESKPASQRKAAVVHHSINGSFAIRKDEWKLCFCAGSGGWSQPTPNSAKEKDLPPHQLFDLKNDIGETKNLAAENTAKITELTDLLASYVSQGRSTPGAPQKNTVEVDWRKDEGKRGPKVKK